MQYKTDLRFDTQSFKVFLHVQQNRILHGSDEKNRIDSLNFCIICLK